MEEADGLPVPLLIEETNGETVLHLSINNKEPIQEEVKEEEEDSHANWRKLYWRVEFYNVLVMSLGFLALFAAYNTIQNYVTSLLPGTHPSCEMCVIPC